MENTYSVLNDNNLSYEARAIYYYLESQYNKDFEWRLFDGVLLIDECVLSDLISNTPSGNEVIPALKELENKRLVTLDLY